MKRTITLSELDYFTNFKPVKSVKLNALHDDVDRIANTESNLTHCNNMTISNENSNKTSNHEGYSVKMWHNTE